MKRDFLLVLALLAISCIQINAAVSVNQLTESEYLYNNGYSEATTEEIMIAKSRANGKPSEPIYDNHNRFVRFFRNIYGYIDPAQDTDERIHHDIHLSPNVKDL